MMNLEMLEIWIFETFKKYVLIVELNCAIVGVVFILNCYFLMRLSNSLSFSVYMNIHLKIVFNIVGKCSRSVNKSRTKYCFVILCDLLVFVEGYS